MTVKWDYPERMAVTCAARDFRGYEYPLDANRKISL